MPVARAKLSSRYQLVIPKAIRRQTNLKPGMSVLFDVHGDNAIHIQTEEGWAKSSYGLGREMWASIGGGERYLRELRKEWDDREKQLEEIFLEARRARRTRRTR